MQKGLVAWFEQQPGRLLNYEAFNWLQDVPRTLLCNIEHSQDPPISFFEKMMVVRDLAREYNMSDILSSGER